MDKGRMKTIKLSEYETIIIHKDYLEIRTNFFDDEKFILIERDTHPTINLRSGDICCLFINSHIGYLSQELRPETNEIGKKAFELLIKWKLQRCKK